MHEPISHSSRPFPFGWVLAALLLMASLMHLFNSLSRVDEPMVLAPIPVAPQTLQKLKTSPPSIAAVSELPESLRQEGLLLRTQIVRGVDETINTFYRDGHQVAQQTIEKDGTIQLTGTIPNGSFKFVDEYNHTQGEISFLNGRKIGTQKAFYPGGQLQSETVYKNGQLWKYKEYYANGQIRFEQDLEDGRLIPNDKETGIGKLYYPNGVLKFEWNITYSTRPGYKKSYNTDGTLRAQSLFEFDPEDKPVPLILPPEPSALNVQKP